MARRQTAIIRERIGPVPEGELLPHTKIGLAQAVIEATRRAFRDPEFQKQFEKWHLETYGYPYVEDGKSKTTDV